MPITSECLADDECFRSERVGLAYGKEPLELELMA